ncbi:MAG: DNA polymerase III subunit delta' [Desulfovibrio sp.]|jgi:DNA polymerase-3 subunit delta'|nr:DNA polymerase III subunit delta' [Desulfovibrio sp.]
MDTAATDTGTENGGKEAGSGDILPDRQAAEDLFLPVRAFMRNARMASCRTFLELLAQNPPQSLLLEGGDATQRLAAAHYWTLFLNCDPEGVPVRPKAPAPSFFSLPGLAPARKTKEDRPQAATDATDRPCLQCAACLRFIAHMHRDCFFFDGAGQSIKIDELRPLKSVCWEQPREARFRVIIIREAQAMTLEASNTLLKLLEEPVAATSFALLAPQRERLLPTLVSRSFVLTLPWERQAGETENFCAWEPVLCAFLERGQGLFARSAVKGAVDAALVQNIIDGCARALIAAFSSASGGESRLGGLGKIFSALPAANLRILDELLAEGRENLNRGVNPVLTLEWLMLRAYFLLHPSSARSGETGGPA